MARDPGDPRDHIGAVGDGLGMDHGRGVLQIHQHDVRRECLQSNQARSDGILDLIQVVALPGGIGSDLPDHHSRIFGDDLRFKPRELVGRFLAIDAAVDDVRRWIAESQRVLQQLRIRLRTAFAKGRRRADGYDLDAVLVGHASRHVGKRVAKADDLAHVVRQRLLLRHEIRSVIK
nr:hypothetical protein [Bradyrhizobium prioritasuperba]